MRATAASALASMVIVSGPTTMRSMSWRRYTRATPESPERKARRSRSWKRSMVSGRYRMGALRAEASPSRASLRPRRACREGRAGRHPLLRRDQISMSSYQRSSRRWISSRSRSSTRRCSVVFCLRTPCASTKSRRISRQRSAVNSCSAAWSTRRDREPRLKCDGRGTRSAPNGKTFGSCSSDRSFPASLSPSRAGRSRRTVLDE